MLGRIATQVSVAETAMLVFFLLETCFVYAFLSVFLFQECGKNEILLSKMKK